jgi:hypothetical protein
VQVVDYFMDTVLSEITTTAGILNPTGTYLGMATSIVDLADLTTMAQVTPCTGSVAPRQAIGSWTGPYRMNDGRAVIDGTRLEFGPTISTDNQVVGGWYLANASVAGSLLAYSVFPQPIALVNGGTPLGFVIRITLDPQGRWSAEVVYNG